MAKKKVAAPPAWLEIARRWRETPGEVKDVSDLAARLGLAGSGELDEQTRRHFHASPDELLLSWRLEAARRALLEGSRGAAQIAAELGFSDQPSFEEAFRRTFMISPEAFRSLPGQRRWTLELPAWWRQEGVVRYWGRDPSSRHEVATERGIRWALNGPDGPVGLEVRLPKLGAAQRTADVEIVEPRHPPSRSSREDLEPWAHLTLLRLLGLHHDPEDFERRTLQGPHRALVESRRGLVIPQTASVFDGVAWVVCGQQVSLPVAFKLRRGLAERFGRPVGDLLTTPTSADLASAEEGELFALGFSRRKEEYLCGIARLAQGAGDEALDLESLRRSSAPEIEQRLLAVRGFGPWSVNYLCMRSFGLADCVPVGDVALERALERFFRTEKRPKADRTRELMQVFAPHRSLASFHLWATLQDGSG